MKNGHTRRDIVRCTIELLQRKGPEGLSFAAVAASLKIPQKAAQSYFTNLAQLEDEAMAVVVGGIRSLSAYRPEPVREQLLKFGMDLIQRFRLHPYLRRLSGPATVVAAGKIHNANAQALMTYGIDFRRAITTQVLIQLVASGLADMQHGRARQWRTKRIRDLYFGQFELPTDAMRMTLGEVAPNSPGAARGMLEMVIDSRLPELSQ